MISFLFRCRQPRLSASITFLQSADQRLEDFGGDDLFDGRAVPGAAVGRAIGSSPQPACNTFGTKGTDPGSADRTAKIWSHTIGECLLADRGLGRFAWAARFVDIIGAPRSCLQASSCFSGLGCAELAGLSLGGVLGAPCVVFLRGSGDQRPCA